MKTLLLVTVAAFVGCCMFNCSRRVQVDEPYGANTEQSSLFTKSEDVSWIDNGFVPIVTWHPSGTLLKDAESANVYVINGAEKHWIADETVFNAHGWKWEQVITAAPEEMACYEESRAVDWAPARVFFQVLGNDSFYLLEKESATGGCTIYLMPTLLALKTWGATVEQVEVLSEYDAQDRYFSKCELNYPLFVRAGALVKPLFSVEGFGVGVIFVADGNATLRPFLNYEVFAAMGYTSAPMNLCEDEDEFYASFVKFGEAISFDTATMCAVPQGVDPEADEEQFVAPDVILREPQDDNGVLPQDDVVGEFDEDAEASSEDVEALPQDDVEDAEIVECEISCPSGMNAWVWYGAAGELTSLELLKFALTKEQICERGFPWVDYNCALPDWSSFDPTMAQIQCNHSFVNHAGVIDFNGEGELFFDDFVCYEWEPPIAKLCGDHCVAVSAYYLYRADFALVDIELIGSSLDFSSKQKVAISADEYYHVEVGNVPAGIYKLQYSTVNEEPAHFGKDWIEFLVDGAGNVEIMNL